MSENICGNESSANLQTGERLKCARFKGHGGHHNACDRGEWSLCWTHPKCKGCGIELDGAILAEYQLSSSDKPYCAACYDDRERARAVETGSVVYGIGDRVIGHTKPVTRIKPFEISIALSGDAVRASERCREQLEKMMRATIGKSHEVFEATIKRANAEISKAILGSPQCRSCSSSATDEGYCAYCWHRKKVEPIGDAGQSGHGNHLARARNEAALAAERPRVTKSSREAEKPHPWESWSTPGDES